MVNNDSDRPLFSFAIVADSHLTKEENLSFGGSDAYGSKLAAMYDDLIARVNAMNPEFVVHLGDITDPVPVSPEIKTVDFDVDIFWIRSRSSVTAALSPTSPLYKWVDRVDC